VWDRDGQQAGDYLHSVFDLWVHPWRKREARADVIVVRSADDVRMGFQYESETDAAT
jgi:hypothetical protein